jgi:hypothetical protein
VPVVAFQTFWSGGEEEDVHTTGSMTTR